MSKVKPVVFLGSSLEDLRAFPVDARREAGYQIDKLQRGSSPESWKQVPTIGAGIQEIRIRDVFGSVPGTLCD